MATKSATVSKVWKDPLKSGEEGYRYKVVLDDGTAYMTKFPEIGNPAMQMEGLRVNIEYDDKNFLKAISSADAPASAWATAEEAWNAAPTAKPVSETPKQRTKEEMRRTESLKIAVELLAGSDLETVKKYELACKIAGSIELFLASAPTV